MYRPRADNVHKQNIRRYTLHTHTSQTTVDKDLEGAKQIHLQMIS